MPLYDYECFGCGDVFESIQPISRQVIECPKCQHISERIISSRAVSTFNEDAEWIRSVTDVVGRDNPLPEAQRFLKEPTRSNYKSWMNAQGIRPLESGERNRPQKFDEKRHAQKIMEMRTKRNSISI